MKTETLHEAIHNGTPLGIGTKPELLALCAQGSLPPRGELSFRLVGTYPVAA